MISQNILWSKIKFIWYLLIHDKMRSYKNGKFIKFSTVHCAVSLTIKILDICIFLLPRFVTFLLIATQIPPAICSANGKQNISLSLCRQECDPLSTLKAEPAQWDQELSILAYPVKSLSFPVQLWSNSKLCILSHTSSPTIEEAS